MKTHHVALGNALVLAALTLSHGTASAKMYDIIGPGQDYGTAIASNSTGQTFIAGTFQGSVDLGPAVAVLGTGTVDGYLAMIDGSIAWAVSVGSTIGAVNVDDIATLSNGDVVVVGMFTDDLIPGGLVSLGKQDAFVARYDATGAVVWAAQIGGDDNESAWGVAVDSQDNIYVTGHVFESTTGTTIFDAAGVSAAVIASNDAFDGFVVSYDQNGSYRWNDVASGPGFDYGWSVATGEGDDVYVTGSFSETVTVAGASLTSAGFNDVFVASYDSFGANRWALAAGGAGGDEGRGITVAASGEVLVTGFITDLADFSGISAASSGAGDEEMFLARYDAAGAIQWVGTNGTAFDDRGFSVAETPSGSFAVAGYTNDAFGDAVVLFDGAGTVINGWGPGGLVIGDDVTTDPLSGSVRITGNLSGPDAFVASH